MIDEKSKTRAEFASRKQGPRVALLDENGTTRAALGAIATETPDGKVIANPESSLLLFDPDGKVSWQTP